MSATQVIIVRVYLTESKHLIAPLLKYLHDECQVRGVTVFRGITGFGKSGKLHSSRLLDMSLDLPVVIEFFDTAERVQEALVYLNQQVEPGHIVSWPAELN
jgi:PII-like signaling protein